MKLDFKLPFSFTSFTFSFPIPCPQTGIVTNNILSKLINFKSNQSLPNYFPPTCLLQRYIEPSLLREIQERAHLLMRNIYLPIHPPPPPTYTRHIRAVRFIIIFFFSFFPLESRREKTCYMESRTIISMKIVAPGQMSHGDKGLTGGWRKMHRTRVHRCSA